MNKVKVNFKKIEDIQMELKYKNAQQFALDCWVTYPTYLAVKKTKTSGMKFLIGLDTLVAKEKGKENGLPFYLADKK